MTSSTSFIPQNNSPFPDRENLPTMYDLPSENPEEPGLPDEFHFLQPLLLFLAFLPVNWQTELVYSAVDLNLYYDVNHTLWYKRPDWFGVVGVPRLYQGKDLRLSYVTWQEKVNPFVVVELLSPGTEEEDLGELESQSGKPPTKWQVYEQILQVPYYIIFSRYTNELQGFCLVNGKYEPMNFRSGRLLIPNLGLSLGLWFGSFLGVERLWLRWFTLEGELISISDEQIILVREENIHLRQQIQEAEQKLLEAQQEAEIAKQQAQQSQQEAEQAKQQAQQSKQEAEQAKKQAEQFAERLRQLGINLDE
jgi:Uma2 family endonuclease